MRLSLLFISLALLSPSLPQGEKQLIIYVKHLEPPLRYPPLARQVQFQGTVIVKLTIAADGTVGSAEALTPDQNPDANAHPLLRDETLKLVKKWTFGCANCSPGVPYDKTIKFIYRLEGEEISYDDSKVVMDLPDRVTITVSPRKCPDCPEKKPSNGDNK